MNRTRFAMVMLTTEFILLACTPLHADIWHAGYRVGLDGYASDGFSEGEYLSIVSTMDPLPWRFARPALHAGVLLPSLSAGEGPPKLTAGVGLTLMTIQDHPFDNLLRRDSALTPRIDATLYVSADTFRIDALSLFFQPLTLHFGEKQIGVMGLHAVKDFESGRWGWGLRLFEISHYVW